MIGSWIVPLVITLAAVSHALFVFSRAKEQGIVTLEAAAKAKIGPDALAEIAMLFFLMWRGTSVALIAWIVWAAVAK